MRARCCPGVLGLVVSRDALGFGPLVPVRVLVCCKHKTNNQLLLKERKGFQHNDLTDGVECNRVASVGRRDRYGNHKRDRLFVRGQRTA
jgi:hypothetical protein